MTASRSRLTKVELEQALKKAQHEHRRFRDEVEGKLDGLEGQVETLRRDHQTARKRIDKLKQVARFYRGQRDRIDGYLSGILDMVPAEPAEQKQPNAVDAARAIMDSAQSALQGTTAPAASATPNRPELREPLIASDETSGRRYAGYRDQEPAEDWETY